jgi:hypothetical protein
MRSREKASQEAMRPAPSIFRAPILTALRSAHSDQSSAGKPNPNGARRPLINLPAAHVPSGGTRKTLRIRAAAESIGPNFGNGSFSSGKLFVKWSQIRPWRDALRAGCLRRTQSTRNGSSQASFRPARVLERG